MIDKHKPCQFCGKPFESVMHRGKAAGRPAASLLSQHELNCPSRPVKSVKDALQEVRAVGMDV